MKFLLMSPDSLFYGDADGIPAGIITVAQPSLIGAGVFSSILNTGNFLNNGINANVEIKPTGTGLVTIQPRSSWYYKQHERQCTAVDSNK